jgi:tellurite resistance-related uncharacterized protein
VIGYILDDKSSVPEPASVIPAGLTVYKRTPEFNEETIPAGLLRAHSTKDGVWGCIRVLEGELLYRIVDARREKRETVLDPVQPGVVEPTILHFVQPRGATRFFVEFLRPSHSA